MDIKAPRVKAVDATGAGDALNGALAAALATGAGLEAAARRAVMAASISVTRAGAREGMPMLAELEAALDQASPRTAAGPEPDGGDVASTDSAAGPNGDAAA